MAGYLTVAEANALMDGRPYSEKWSALTEPQQEYALEAGADWIDKYNYKGSPYAMPPTQLRQWPRNISTERIYVYADTPVEVKYASVLLGMVEFEDDEVTYGGTSMFEMQGMFSANYMPGKEQRNPAQILTIRALKAIGKYRQQQTISRG
jgi:hypothetical protein